MIFHFKPKSSSSDSCINLPIPVPVLVLEYYPPDPKNSTLLDGNETGWRQDAQIEGRTIKFWEQKTQEMISKGIILINNATRYHGYKDSSAPQFLNYQILEDKKFYQPIPKGYLLEKKANGDAVRPDYGGILRNLNICDYVDNKGVKEIWMYGYHNDNGIVPDESRMSSKYGDVSNSYPKEQYIEEQYRMPICKNSYVLYNFTYQPNGDPGNNLHNRLHQIENIIPYAEGTWPPTVQNTQGSIFWGDFAEYLQEDSPFVQQGFRISSYRSSCGNAHITPNWSNMRTQGYVYDLKQQGEFNCETWNPDDSKTAYIKAGCERWGCTDIGFYKYFMQNIPGYNNGIEYNGQKMRNWWEAMYDFNAFIDKGRSLFGDSIFCINQPTGTRVQSLSYNSSLESTANQIVQTYAQSSHELPTPQPSSVVTSSTPISTSSPKATPTPIPTPTPTTPKTTSTPTPSPSPKPSSPSLLENITRLFSQQTPTPAPTSTSTPIPQINIYDLNSDGDINTFDSSQFLQDWRSGNLRDFNYDQVTNSIDFALLKKEFIK